MERLTRRNILGAASAFAGGSALAAGPAIAAVVTSSTTDPVALLGARRRELYAEAVRLSDIEEQHFVSRRRSSAEGHAAGAAARATWQEVRAVEARMIPMVATTAAGVAEQIEVPRDLLALEEFEPMIDSMIAGLRTLAAGGAA